MLINLIPMAGEGKRYKDVGYTVPKPLITVSEKPMVIQAADSLPKADQWVFICREEHIKNYGADNILKVYSPDTIVLTVSNLTEGQASTCLLAKDFINNEDELFIGACDNGMIWDAGKFNKVKLGCDCLVWTFRNNPAVLRKPQAYGWVVIKEGLNVVRTSVKIPISNTPMNDHAIIGAFWFRKGNIFVRAVEEMISQNRRINNEFYVDECVNDVIGLGFNVKVFEVEKYICWGTPEDLKTYEYWRNFFSKYDRHLNKKTCEYD